MEGRSVEHNFGRDRSIDHPCQVWFNLVQGFQTDGRTDRRRTPSDGKSSHGLWPGELKKEQAIKTAPQSNRKS